MSDGKKAAADEERDPTLEWMTDRSWERIQELYQAGEVKRLHTVPTHRQQSIAEHVYGSLLLAMELCASVGMGDKERAEVLVTLLYHDAPEVATGDIPAPVKREDPAIKAALDTLEERFYNRLSIALPSLAAAQRSIVHASDTLDLAFTCLRERGLGNRNPRLYTVFNNCMWYLVEHDQIIPAVAALRERCWKEWTRGY